MGNHIASDELIAPGDLQALYERVATVRDGSFWESDFHEAAADTWGVLNYSLGLPTVVLSAIASASALAEFDKSNVIAGILALIVAVLSALATFLNAEKTAESHRKASALYKTLGLRAQSFGRSLKPTLAEADFVDGVSALEDEFHGLIRDSPSYSRRTRRRAEARIQADARSDYQKAAATSLRSP